MKEITLNNQDYLLVEVPSDAVNIRFIHIDDWKLKHLVFDCGKEKCYSSDFIDAKLITEIIGKVSDILKDEEICKGLVESYDYQKNKPLNPNIDYVYYKDYTFDFKDEELFDIDRAIYSFQSWLESICLELTKEWIMIKLKKI